MHVILNPMMYSMHVIEPLDTSITSCGIAQGDSSLSAALWRCVQQQRYSCEPDEVQA